MSASDPATPAATAGRSLPAWARLLHTYLSMAGLGTLLFFSATGLTLNHPGWSFGTRRHEERLQGQLDAALLAAGRDEGAVDRLAVAESLRRLHGVTGLVDDFRVDDDEVSVAFKGPGFSADAVVARKTGKYRLTVMREGWVALVNDLHKGRHTGPGWALLIDVAAVLLVLVSATGLWLMLHVRRRRTAGLVAGLVGSIAVWAMYRALVR